MKICAISDLHGNLINIDPCELLLICGDIVPLNIQRNKSQCEEWLKNEFTDWLISLPCSKVVFIAGNHDFYFENKSAEDIRQVIPRKATYLENNYYNYLSDGGKIYRIFGTPACKIFGNWAFMYGPETLISMYSKMPSNCDILISHDAPDLNNCGLIPRNLVNAGNPWLADFILDKKPIYAFCGHIHNGNHELSDIENTKIVNVSILDDNYKVHYEPFYCDI